ncbi:MAG TPA: dienelactone hydrolase family protein [Acidobacteriota bacterium]|nr:dienelactone hydrolase family protein [Acidobacteriota bacterium]
MNQALHQNQRVLAGGEPLEEARAAMIMLHGRGAGARDILGLASYLKVEGFAFLAPQAAHSVWYPDRFMAPLQSNEPWLSSALQRVGEMLEHCREKGIPAQRTVLLGFSQGACLALEYAARNARRYGALAALSGGLIGPPEEPRNDQGHLQGTPVYLGCSDVDPHIPLERVEFSAAHLEEMGGEVKKEIFPAMGHTVMPEELDQVASLMRELARA